MLDFIVIVIISLLMMIAVQSNQKNEDGGNSLPKIKGKKLKNVVGQRKVVVKGMTSGSDKKKVEQAVNGIYGASAGVNLKKKTVTVAMERNISDKEIREAIEKAGFEVLSMR